MRKGEYWRSFKRLDCGEDSLSLTILHLLDITLALVVIWPVTVSSKQIKELESMKEKGILVLVREWSYLQSSATGEVNFRPRPLIGKNNSTLPKSLGGG